MKGGLMNLKRSPTSKKHASQCKEIFCMYRNPLGLAHVFREPRTPEEDTITMDTAHGFVSACPLLLNLFPP